MQTTDRIDIENEWVAVAGAADANLKLIREAMGVSIAARDGTVQIAGDRDQVAAAGRLIRSLDERAGRRQPIDRHRVLEMITRSGDDRDRSDGSGRGPADRGPISWSGDLDVYAAGRRIKPRSDNQAYYLEAIRSNDLVFGLGPAGTGKTYLAVAAAVHLLKADRVRKIVLVRPAVEAGERLGFLPGDLEAKVNPYLRPLIDALHDMVDFGTLRRFSESDVLEIAPLAYMRGRTLNHAVVILDEAQNTTVAQMKMFLTRLGHGSKMIVTGDPTQVDLPDAAHSGLIDAARRFRRLRGVGFVALEKTDVVRHPLVQRVIDAYDGDDRRGGGAQD
ncbi:MAG: PhoH family protein, partial [Planctomycetota bacterium]